MSQRELFLRLIQVSLWNQHSHFGPLDNVRYRALMQMADQQAVRGLVSNSILDETNAVILKRDNALETLRFDHENKQLNSKIDAGLSALVDLLDFHQIRFVVVKGQTIECLYPIRHLRIGGDIDFYVMPEDFERAKTLLQQEWNVKYEEGDANKHLEFIHNHVIFEMHYLLLHFASNRVQKEFDTIVKCTKIVRRKMNGISVPVLAPEFEILYTFLHLYHHFLEVGIGIRHLCDMAVLCHYHFSNGLDKRLLKSHLDKLGFTKAFSAFGAVCIQTLRLQENEFPIPVDTNDYRFVEPIMAEIFLRGNMGVYFRKHAVRSGFAYFCESLSSKIHLYRLFYSLAPKETRALIWREIPTKILRALKL